jgi:hypothetical protein
MIVEGGPGLEQPGKSADGREQRSAAWGRVPGVPASGAGPGARATALRARYDARQVAAAGVPLRLARMAGDHLSPRRRHGGLAGRTGAAVR